MATHSSILENPVDKGACRATVHRVTKSQRPLKQLSTHAHTRIVILGFSGGSVVKNLPASAEDTGSILSQEDTLEKKMATQSSIFVWQIS